MNPLGAALTALFVAVALAAPRRWAALAILAAICYLTQGQMLDAGGFHLTSLRLVLLAVVIRVLTRGEFREIEFNAIDKGVVLYLLAASIIHPLSRGTMSALVYQMGLCYNIGFSYFGFRCLLRDLPDLEDFLGGLAWLLIPLALLMCLESLNGKNWFSAFGAVQEVVEFRDGHYRCQGPFRSPITAGTLGATLMPLFVGLYYQGGRQRRAAIVGVVAATVIMITSHSSGPFLAYIGAVGALAFWRWRDRVRLVRWGFVLGLIALHLVMKAPVWYVIAHISDVVGGGGWHRAYLIDQAVHHFGSWWLVGTDDTGGWMETQLEDGTADITNQYICEGLRSGLLGMLLFIWMIVKGFRYLGQAGRSVAEQSPETEKTLWALGAALFGTVVNFFSVAYYDQIESVWYLLLAVIAGSTFAILNQEQEAAVAAGSGLEEPEDYAAQPL